MAAPLPYLLTAENAIDLQKVSLSDRQNLKTVSEHTECYGKYSLFNRGNLTQRIEMQLSQKQKVFSDFFSAFFKSGLNFEHFLKIDDPLS